MDIKPITYLALLQYIFITFGFLLVSFLYRYYPDAYPWSCAIYIKHYGYALLLVPLAWVGLALFLQSLDRGKLVTTVLPYGTGIIIFLLLLYVFGTSIAIAFSPDNLVFWNKTS